MSFSSVSSICLNGCTFTNLHDLKAKIGGIAILVVVIAFIEQLLTWKNAQDMLYFALAIGIISAVLIAYSQFGGED